MRETGRVDHVFRKLTRGEGVVPSEDGVIELKARHGIVDDRNANPISPRQVLLTDADLLDAFQLLPGQLRENIVVRDLDLHALESGTVLQIGEQVQIRVTFSCEPCQFLTTLNIKPSAMRGRRGMLGVVLQGGKVRRGDTVAVRPERFPALSEEMYERFVYVLAHVPAGQVITYKQLVTAIGGSSSYVRVIPAYIKRALASGTAWPVHRIVDAQGQMIPHAPNQKQLLQAEGLHTDQESDLLAAVCDLSELYYRSDTR